MQKVSIAIVALVASVVAAKADGFTPAVNTAPRAVSCYVKAYGAGDFVTQRAEITGVVIDSLGQKGLGIGGQVGCDFRQSVFVAGLFADYTWNRANTSITALGVPVMSVPFGSEWSVGGRLGVNVGPAMVYGLLAYTVAQERDAAMGGISLALNGPKGIAAGAGLEYALTQHIVTSVEYRHVAFDSNTSNVIPSKFTMTDDQLRIGLGFRF